jgi:hypothetical protein
MNKVRVTVQTSFTYEYGSKANHLTCGAIMYYDPSLESELEELKYVMSSIYLKRGFLSVEESIKEDFQNKTGIFAEKIIVSEQVSTVAPVTEEEVKVEVALTEITSEPIDINNEAITLENRKTNLEALKAAEVKAIAEGLGLVDYTNKTSAIEYILKVEYSG